MPPLSEKIDCFHYDCKYWDSWLVWANNKKFACFGEIKGSVELPCNIEARPGLLTRSATVCSRTSKPFPGTVIWKYKYKYMYKYNYEYQWRFQHLCVQNPANLFLALHSPFEAIAIDNFVKNQPVLLCSRVSLFVCVLSTTDFLGKASKTFDFI